MQERLEYADDFDHSGLVLNILTRTSNRPNGFKRCRESILAQKWGGRVRHVVSIDRPNTYVEADVVVPATGKVDPPIPVEHQSHRDAPYNLYVNDMLQAVGDGWVLVLDDDDELLNEQSLAAIEPYMNDPDNLIVFKFVMKPPAGFIMPKYFGRELVMNDVPCACYAYHSKYRELGYWHRRYAADFSVASRLAERLKTVWVDEVVAGTQHGPSVGSLDIVKYRPWEPRNIEEKADKKVFVSIIIPVMNQLKYTEAILENLWRTVKTPHEIIVIDNGSTDGTTEFLKRGGVRAIRNERNVGMGASWNQGCEMAKGTHLAILNNDLLLPNGWLETLLRHEEHAICPSYTQGGVPRKDFEEHNKNLMSGDPIEIVTNEPGQHPYGFAGFIFMISREAWERTGPFDEKFLYWYGDNDYWIRLKGMGFRPMMSKNVLIHHYLNKTCKAIPDFIEQREKDRHRFLVKWPEGVKRRPGEVA